MNKILYINAAAVLLAIFCLLLFCTNFKNNNPATTSYQGNYSLSLSWSQPSETLEVFKQYKIACVVGSDTFSSYKVDSSTFPMVIDEIKWDKVDTLFVHFFRPINDTDSIEIEGVRPNNQTIIAIIHAHVINPYFIKPDTNAINMGDTLIASVTRLDNKPAAQGLFVIWSVNGTTKAKQSDLVPDTIIPAIRDTLRITALLQDVSGSGLYLDIVRMPVGSYPQKLTAVALKTTAVLGSSLTLSITQTDLDSSKFRVFVISSNGVWRDSSLTFLDFSGNATIPLGRPVIDTSPQTDTIYTVDVDGIKSNVLMLSMTVSYSLPVVNFTTADTLIVALKDTTPVTLDLSSTGNKFIWVLDSDSLRPDTTTSKTLKVFLQDMLAHTLTVKGVDQYNNVGAPVSKPMRARNFAYVVQPIAFPLYPKINTWTTWIAAVKDTALARQKNAHFHWTINPVNYDSIRITGADSSTLELRWSGIFSTTISVIDTDNFNDICAPYSQSVSVRRYAPSIKFMNIGPLNEKTTDTIKLIVSAIDSNIDGTITNSTIQKVLWQRTGKVSAKDSTNAGDTTWKIVSVNPDTFDVYARARDNDGFLSQPDTIQVIVKAYRPFIQPLMQDMTIFIGSPVRFKVYGNVSDTSAKIAKYLWDFDGNGTWDDSTAFDTITYKFTAQGKTTVIVKCRDNNNLESVPDAFVVTISTGAPAKPAMKPDTAWIFDNTLYTITSKAMNPNAHLVQYGVQWDAGGLWENGSSWVTDTMAFMHHAYTTAGLKQVAYYVKDNNGFSSDTVNDAVIVRLGAPSVAAVTMDSLPTKIFIRDSLHFFVHGSDTNGQIDSIKVAWNGDTAFNAVNKSVQGDSAVFAMAFATSGAKQVRFRVYDDDGLSADSVFSLFVRLGRPKVLAFTPDTAVFIKDNYAYTISAIDTNGTVASYWVAWDNAAFGQIGGTGVTTAKALTTAGKHPVAVYAKDNDNLYSDTLRDTVNVRLAAPVIDSMHVPFIAWINDDSTYRVIARDTNGTVSQYYFDWTNSGAWQDSNATGIIQAHFSTSGAKTIQIGVRDDDGNVTTSTKQITVHLGAPRVWNPGGDTMFVVAPSGGGKIRLDISSMDSNGTIPNYYWDYYGPNFDTLDGGIIKNSTPFDTLQVLPPSMNNAMKMAVFGKDDDGNVAGDTFWLFPDAPPPAPTLHDAETVDSVTIYWKGKDVKDGDQTQYRVLVHNNNEPDSAIPADILSNWKSGYLASDLSQYDYMFKFKVAHSANLYYYQVHARDARGSITSSTTGHTFSY